ncbi:cadherin-87A-like isoform X2 [Babylonia areolata]|uniref:cadherin-87A-like isoform X2 n=1 Tax=Babylonia areolata TaxID=304850 RepID=UPI003FD57719
MWLPLLAIFVILQVPGIWGTNPEFTNKEEIAAALGRIYENQTTDVVLVRAHAIVEGNLRITYSINDDTYFKIVSDTGDISLKATWDYDTKPKSLSLDITATDTEGDSRTYNQPIILMDVNDNKPVFSETQQETTLTEDHQVGSIVFYLTVNDVDTVNPAYMSVECVNAQYDPNDDTCRIFVLEVDFYGNKNWEGHIFLNQSLDYEKKNSYSIRLRASDGQFDTVHEIQIKVLDINDSPPRFIRAESKIIPEGDPVGTVIDYVLAIDSDQADARPIRYELIGNDEAQRYFAVNPIDGNITNKIFLDYEAPDRRPGEAFNLQFKARELLNATTQQLGDDPTTTAVTSITITLTDINDNCPIFSRDRYTFNVPENIVTGTNLYGQLELNDKDYITDNRQFTLSLIDPSNTFELDFVGDQTPASIFIRVIDSRKIDYESNTKAYDLVVVARDKQKPDCSASTTVHVEVQDVNDESPQFTKRVFEAEVSEDARGGTSVITVSATDRDSKLYGNDGLRYSFIDHAEGLFRIDPVTGTVYVEDCPTPGVKRCIDYEWEKSYSISVRVEDNLGNDPSKNQIAELIITILNVNDNPPEFIGNYTRFIQEGKTKVENGLFVKAVDSDRDQVTYSLVNSRDAAFWTINQNTGEITARNPIKLNDTINGRGVFRFSAAASDGSGIRTTAGIIINVIDINDNTPTFTQFEKTVSIREDYPKNTLVTTVTVSDADSPTSGNGQVEVSIDSGNYGKFKVKNVTLVGAFYVAEIHTSDGSFDYDLNNRYNLTLRARDKGSPALTGSSTLIVNILDTNNKDPYFEPPTISVSVSENVPVSTTVITLTAKDDDADSDLKMSFGSPIVARNPSGVSVTDPTLFQNLFRITEDGVVLTNQLLDRDTVSSLEFPLVVRDVKASPAQTGTGSLYIRILEYNDQAPYFELPLYQLSVREEIATGTFVTSLLALDEDDQIETYQLTQNPDNLFSIDAQTGVLSVNGRLDYESRHNVTLIARAFDTGRPQLSNTTRVFIRIININDNPPVFNQTIYELHIPEGSTQTTPVGAVYATDLDEGDFGVVRYTSDNEYFTVDLITGEVYLKPGAKLDREEQGTHTFQVRAYDSPLNESVRLFATTQVYIVLDDINDNCPRFMEGNSFNGTIIETADVGDQVLEIFATDDDADDNRLIKFTIDENSFQPPSGRNLFSILSKSYTASIESGRIEVSSRLVNRSGVYTFTVIASDQKGINTTGTMCSSRANVAIRVQKSINDPPEWRLPPSRNFSIDVLESQYNGMLVYDCLAVDKNEGKEGVVDYYFRVGPDLVHNTSEFRINLVTGVISATIVYDREQVSSYVLTVVAKDQGNPSASSETVLIVNVLDVNDNEPQFNTRTYRFPPVTEGMSPEDVGLIGTVSATDKDTDHKNNKVYYRIVAGNEDGLFELGKESGNLTLSPTATNGLDRETKDEYKMDILAYNDVNDDTVIRYRRSTNPSVATVIVTVRDINDTPPKFVKSDYHGCVSRDAGFKKSILTVKAEDPDVSQEDPVSYSKVSEDTGDYFTIEATSGDIGNAKSLRKIGHNVALLRIQASDGDSEGANAAETSVKIFITDKENEVKLVVTLPSSEARHHQDQLIRALTNTSGISYVCIREIRDHIGDDGAYSYTMSDVFLSAVKMEDGKYQIYDGTALLGKLSGQMPQYKTILVKSVEQGHTESSSTDEDTVLAISIIACLLILLAFILICLACCLIHNSKKKKVKKLRAVGVEPQTVYMAQPAPEVGTNVNPVYDNRAFQPEEEAPYAVVQKPKPAPEFVAAPIVPVMVPVPDEVPEPQPPEEPVPFIITEPVMSEEVPAMQPPPQDFFTSEPEVVFMPDTDLPPPEPEPLIETVIETEVIPEDESPDTRAPETSAEDEIDVEFRGFGDSPSPPRSESPPAPPRSESPPAPPRSESPPASIGEEEYRIETNLM